MLVMKTSMSEMKIILDEIKSKFNTANKKIYKLEYLAVETMQNETQRGKKQKN